MTEVEVSQTELFIRVHGQLVASVTLIPPADGQILYRLQMTIIIYLYSDFFFNLD